MADGTFHRSGRASGHGPNSNTGQKSSLSAPIIDACTVVFEKPKALKCFSKMPLAEVFRYVFGTSGAVVVGSIQEKPFNFYPRSASIIAAEGGVVGKIGIGDDNRLCISLMGQGCGLVPNWRYVADILDDLDARLTRVDIAVDDLTGETFNLQTFKNLHEEGAFVMNGRPPSASFVDDLGSNKGCSLYIGQKGHKQLNVYEKGKQLGDPESEHTRCELRLYAKRLDLPNDALRNPGKYFAGAYPALVAYVIGEAERLDVKQQMVNASAKAMVRFMRTQGGTALNVIFNAFGDEAVEFILEHIVREGRPGRFKSYTGDISALVRNQLSISINEASHESNNSFCPR